MPRNAASGGIKILSHLLAGAPVKVIAIVTENSRRVNSGLWAGGLAPYLSPEVDESGPQGSEVLSRKGHGRGAVDASR